jgi:hypothetical protein
MAVRRSCVKCDKPLRFDASHRRNRKYCRRCAKEAKRERDRRHKQRYRETGLGKEQRRRESTTRRGRVGWAEYMRFYRKADPKRAAALNRDKCQRYYEQHREAILARRRQQRAARKASVGACSP